MCKIFSSNTFTFNVLFLHPLKTLIFHVFWGYKKTNLMKCVKKRLLCVDNFWSVKPFWILNVRKFACRNFFDSLKIFVCGKLRWSSKNFFAENFLVCGKFPWLWKGSWTVENFLDGVKITFLTAEKIIGLIILKKMLLLKPLRQKYYIQSITYAQILNL